MGKVELYSCLIGCMLLSCSLFMEGGVNCNQCSDADENKSKKEGQSSVRRGGMIACCHDVMRGSCERDDFSEVYHFNGGDVRIVLLAAGNAGQSTKKWTPKNLEV